MSGDLVRGTWHKPEQLNARSAGAAVIRGRQQTVGSAEGGGGGVGRSGRSIERAPAAVSPVFEVVLSGDLSRRRHRAADSENGQ